jgi:hypothetical protein
MDSGAFQAKLRSLIDGWDYDFSQFDIAGFTGWVAARRGRPIHVVPRSLPPELFGAWIEGPTADFIFYEDEPLHVHTIHILLHELCHMLLGHKTVHLGNEAALGALSGAVPETNKTQQLLNVLFRQVGYADEQEVEAETLSSLVQQRVFREAGLAALSQVREEPAMRQFLQGIGIDQAEHG